MEKELCKQIQEHMKAYLCGEISFDEAMDKLEHCYNQLFYIRHKNIIDNLIDYRLIAEGDKANYDN